MQREVRIHSQLQHDNIVQMYAAFEDSDHVYLALQFAPGKPWCSVARSIFGRESTSYTRLKGDRWKDHVNNRMHAGGDLYEELKRHGGQLTEERVARDVIRPCLSALAYLHRKV